MDISIVIVNYNGRRFLGDCLKSIAQHVSIQHEVIVVDNTSSDESCEYLREHFPNVLLITSEKNLGFAGGNNLGAKEAKGKYLLLLNNDTVLITDIASGIAEFERDNNLGVLGCRLFYRDKRPQASYGYDHTLCRLLFSWLGLGRYGNLPKIFRRTEPDGADYKTYQPNVEWVSGAFLMTPIDLWKRLDGLDERYFMYIEDVDYCKKVRQAGYCVSYTPEIEVIHFEGSDKPWIGANALKNTMRSYLVYAKKFYVYSKYSVLLLRLGLSMIMAARAVAFYSLSLISKSKIVREKAKAYTEVSFQLLLG